MEPSQGLNPLQERILRALVGFEPPFTLTGGGALAGLYLHHRTTRDLDLFWRDRPELDRLADEVRALLCAEALDVQDLQTGMTFHRLNVTDGNLSCLIDLVADPSPAIEMPTRIGFGEGSLQVDTRYEILVNKLCALLGRSELRDLEDLKALVDAGEDLERGLADAPQKDGGFSPIILAWLLRQFPVEKLARVAGWEDDKTRDLAAFRDRLVEQLLAGSVPT